MLVGLAVSLVPAPASAQSDPFGYGRARLTPTPGTPKVLPVVVAMVNYADQGFAPQHTPASVQQLFAGPGYPNVRDYFLENSGGKLQLRIDQVVQVSMVDDPATVADERRIACLDGSRCPGSRTTDNGLWMRSTVEQLAGAQVNFRQYDTNGNGRVESSELLFVILQAAPSPPSDPWGRWGGTRPPLRACVPVGSGATSTLLCPTAIPDFQEHAGFQTITHELVHSLGIPYDYYGPWNAASFNAGLTVMGSSVSAVLDDRRSVGLDAWHRIVFGWAQPRVVDIASSGACMALDAAHVGFASPNSNRDPIVVWDSRVGPSEFFVIEHRVHSTTKFLPPGGTPASGYDQAVAGSGLIVWSVRTDAASMPVSEHVNVMAGPNVPRNPAYDSSLLPLQAQPPPGSDDVTNSGWRVTWGPDGVLQTTRGTTDVYGDTRGIYALAPVPTAAGPGVFAFGTPGVGAPVRRGHRGVELRWRGNVGTAVYVSSGPDDNTTRQVLVHASGWPIAGSAACIAAATPPPDRAPRASVVIGGQSSTRCIMRATQSTPSKSDPAARSLVSPVFKVPVQVSFGAPLLDATPVRLEVVTGNATLSTTSFVAPVGATQQSLTLVISTPEPYGFVGLHVELDRVDLRAKGPYTETQDVRITLTPDTQLASTDIQRTCADMQAMSGALERLDMLGVDVERPIPLPEPDVAQALDTRLLMDPTYRAEALPMFDPSVMAPSEKASKTMLKSHHVEHPPAPKQVGGTLPIVPTQPSTPAPIPLRAPGSLSGTPHHKAVPSPSATVLPRAIPVPAPKASGPSIVVPPLHAPTQPSPPMVRLPAHVPPVAPKPARPVVIVPPPKQPAPTAPPKPVPAPAPVLLPKKGLVLPVKPGASR